MSAKTTLGRKAGSAIRGPRALERILIVAAIVAVLVAVGAWVAMNRPFGGAEAAGAESSTTSDATSSGAVTDGSATDAATDAASGDQAAAPGAESTAAAPEDGAAGTGSTGSGTGTGTGTGGSAGSGSTGGSSAPAGRTSAPTAPISPTTSFLTALADSGLAPPIDDAQKLAMAEDVCQEMGYGATYADVVRALTFAGASDAEAENFARLSITNLCSQYKIG